MSPMTSAIKVASIAIFFLSEALTLCHAGFFEDFEGGDLSNWTIGGRQFGNHTANVVMADNGSLSGHLYQSGQFTEITFQRDFPFDPDGAFAFDLKVNVASQPPPASNYYGLAGVVFQFLGSGNALLGKVHYFAATTSFPFSALPSATTAVNEIPTNAWIPFATCMDSLLSQIAIDPSHVENVRLRFEVYSSTWPYPSVTAQLWADNVNVPDSDADADSIANCQDNCMLVANASQIDSNADGYGNMCDPDLNNDEIVNAQDLALLRQVFFTSDPDADFTGDGFVNATDLAIMRRQYFGPPGPSGTQVTSGRR